MKKLYIFIILMFLVVLSQTNFLDASDVSSGKEMMNAEGKTVKDGYKMIPFNTIMGKETNLNAFEGKVVLIVNVASECGYTKQYAPLEKLYEQYSDSGLVVIGFPANNFGGQEPGSDEEILKFCTTKFDVKFPMMSKISVKGKDIHPLFDYLTNESEIKGDIEWNFSKFLIDKKGNLVKRFGTKVDPLSDEIVLAIKQLL